MIPFFIRDHVHKSQRVSLPHFMLFFRCSGKDGSYMFNWIRFFVFSRYYHCLLLIIVFTVMGTFCSEEYFIYGWIFVLSLNVVYGTNKASLKMGVLCFILTIRQAVCGQIKKPRAGLVYWSGWRESNPRIQLGKLLLYHWATPAYFINVR